MDKTIFYSNLRFLILGTAIVIGAYLVADGLKSSGKENYQGSHVQPIYHNLDWENPMRSLPITVNTSSNSDDVTYNTELTIQEGASLALELKNGSKRVVSGSHIVATFYHVAKLLVVHYVDADSTKRFIYAHEPIVWNTISK